MKEIWKTIPSYEGYYQVSNKGRVRSIDRKAKNRSGFRLVKSKIIKPTNNGTGYLIVGLSKESKRCNFLIHRLVALCFIDKPVDKNIINHINGIKTDNRVSNLEWCNQMENIRHSIENGLINQLGSNHHSSKLTESDVLKIRKLYDLKSHTYSSISNIYGISIENVRNIIKRITWKHLS